MSLRYSCVMFGRQANTFLIPAAQTSSLRSLALGTAHMSNCYNRTQMRLSSSNVSTLTPPWQYKDLTRPERRAFERYGPNFMEHMPAQTREYIQQMAEKRALKAAELEKKFGSDWYAIMEEATVIKDRQEMVDEKEQLGDAQKYRDATKEEKKAMKAQFFENRNATKAQRLYQAMKEVVANRA